MHATDGTKAQKYLRTQVQTASREQLVVMLFDGAVRFAEAAAQHMTRGEVEGASVRIIRVQDIILELIVSLDRRNGGEIASNLAAIYGYLYMRLVDANARQDPSQLDEVLGHLRSLRETWHEAAALYRQDAAGDHGTARPPESRLSVEG